MPSTVTVFYLALFVFQRGGVVIPMPYPSAELCEQAAKSTDITIHACVPAPAIPPGSLYFSVK